MAKALKPVEAKVAEFIKTFFPDSEVFIAGSSRTALIKTDKLNFVIRLLNQSGEIHTIGATSYLVNAKLDIILYRTYTAQTYQERLEEVRQALSRLRGALLSNPAVIEGYLITWVSEENYEQTLRTPGVISVAISMTLIGLQVKPE